MNVIPEDLDGLSVQEILSELAKRSLADFVGTTMEEYEFNWHHEKLCKALEDFAAGKIKKLMVNMPPQHGKSELTTRRFPAWLLGKYPSKKIAIAAYESTFAQKFNLDIQRIIDSPEYRKIFPLTRLDTGQGKALRNSTEFEVLDNKGSLRVTGVGGSLTGLKVDLMIYDDLYKSRDEALSRAVNEKVWSFIINVCKQRLHNKSQELFVMTRWQPDDAAGRLLSKETGWKVVKFPAIKVREDSDDPRKIGEALWESMHSKQRILEIKKLSKVSYYASYQQEPRPPEDVLVYPVWDEVDNLPGKYPSYYVCDFGFTNDPTAIAEVEEGPEDIWIDELIYKTGLTNPGIRKAMELLGCKLKKPMFCDNAEPKDRQELQDLGINALEGIKGRVSSGVNEIKKKRIHVTRRSHNVKNELLNYQFITFGETITNEIADEWNHFMDAIRYGHNSHKQGVGLKVATRRT